jgi:hypothetical protein
MALSKILEKLDMWSNYLQSPKICLGIYGMFILNLSAFHDYSQVW